MLDIWRPDRSNFDRSDWLPRSGSEHRDIALKYKECATQAQQKAIERETGIRFSVLVELPYFLCSVNAVYTLDLFVTE